MVSATACLDYLKLLSPDFGAEYFQYNSQTQSCRLFSSADRECVSMSGPRGDQLEKCLAAPLPKEYLFLQPSSLLSLLSFSPISCPSLEQFPVKFEKARELVAGLVEDETSQTRLMVNGQSFDGEGGQSSSWGWWLWRNGNWETTSNTSIPRFLHTNS